MTIERLSELYLKGHYSKFDFYLGLIEILSHAGSPDQVMNEVPEELLDDLCEMAEQHVASANHESSEGRQRENPAKILLWRQQQGRGHSACGVSGVE